MQPAATQLQSLGPGQESAPFSEAATWLCTKVTSVPKLCIPGLQSPFQNLSFRKGHFLPKFKHRSQQGPSLSGALLPQNPRCVLLRSPCELHRSTFHTEHPFFLQGMQGKDYSPLFLKTRDMELEGKYTDVTALTLKDRGISI